MKRPSFVNTLSKIGSAVTDYAFPDGEDEKVLRDQIIRLKEEAKNLRAHLAHLEGTLAQMHTHQSEFIDKTIEDFKANWHKDHELNSLKDIDSAIDAVGERESELVDGKEEPAVPIQFNKPSLVPVIKPTSEEVDKMVQDSHNALLSAEEKEKQAKTKTAKPVEPIKNTRVVTKQKTHDMTKFTIAQKEQICAYILKCETNNRNGVQPVILQAQMTHNLNLKYGTTKSITSFTNIRDQVLQWRRDIAAAKETNQEK